MTQSEINILSQYMVELANMERHLLEYRIWNQPNYDKIEKAFTADCEAWEKRGGCFYSSEYFSQAQNGC